MFDDRRVKQIERQEKHTWAIRLRALTLVGVSFVYLYLAAKGRVPLDGMALSLAFGLFAFNRARRFKISRSFSRWMIGLDILLISLAVWGTGGVASFLVPVYFVSVVATSLHTNPRQGVLTALNAWCLFAGMALLQAHGILAPGPLAPTPLLAELGTDSGFVEAQILSMFIFLGAVTYSAGFISQRLRIRERELHAAHDELAILYQASEKFLRARDAQALSRDLLQACQSLGAEEAGLFLEEPGGMHCLGYLPESLGKDTFAQLEIRARAYFDSTPGDTQQRILKEETQYGLVRFHLGDQTRGVLVLKVQIDQLLCKSPEGMSLLAQQFAPALSNLRHLQIQAQLATTDPLTGAKNRREFDRVLREEIARAERYQRPLSLALVDVDHFKKLNDSRGHQDGDRVLIKVVQALKLVTRGQDHVARYGGEEFAVIAPETGPRQAAVLGERLRESIESYEYWDPQDLGPAITASIGLSSKIPGSDQLDYEDLIKRADQALYASKEGGRNRVTAFSNQILGEAPGSKPPPSQE